MLLSEIIGGGEVGDTIKKIAVSFKGIECKFEDWCSTDKQ